jgi:transcriptional regulator with XRE-family HTH domain
MRQKSMGPLGTQDELRRALGNWPEGRLAPPGSGEHKASHQGIQAQHETKWWQRLSARLSDLKWSKADLARRSGVAYDSVNKYLRGAVDNPRGDILEQLSRAVGRDTKWLLFGEIGRAMIAPADAMAAKKFFPLDASITRSSYVTWDQLPRYSDLEVGFEKHSTRASLLNYVSRHRYFSVSVPDRSMEPEFKLNEILICEVDVVCNPDDCLIVSLKSDNDVYFRRFQTAVIGRDSEVQGILKPSNPVFPEILIDRNNPVKILGKIVGYLEGVAVRPQL